MTVKVGCCGWGFYRGGLKSYAKKFSLVEVQQTFYRLPSISAIRRWRAEAPDKFEFCVKAFQALTHPPTSPTWRRSGLSPEILKKKSFGWLRPTRDNFDAWGRVKETCDALGARVCVVQCPPSFRCTSENIEGMREFFSKIERGGLALAWEPRGDWNERPDVIRRLCDELQLIHVVDLMRREPLSEHPVAYIRLHGVNPHEYDYSYRYTDEDLKELAARVRSLAKRHEEVYVMFNNVHMYESAEKLKSILCQ
ncbi:MAG: DUF72 domain-containing protein [Candidatus Hadarchaeales archaeon]